MLLYLVNKDAVEGSMEAPKGHVQFCPSHMAFCPLSFYQVDSMLESVIYTGVELEIMQLADIDALNLLYASGELPDLIYYSGYTGGEQKAIKDKIIQPLNDYMQYAPDLQAVMDSNELYKKSNTTMDGDIIGFPFIRGDDYLRTSAGLIIRQDWLDDLNMELPQTPDI